MRTIIPGPPGTGKTHTLIHKHLKYELINLKTDPKRIAYISFSRAAAREAQQRIFEAFPSYKFDWICTMHYMGKKQLNIDTNTQLLEGKNWNAFKNYSKVCDDMSFENYQHESGYREYKNPYMKIIEYARAKQIDVMESAYELELDTTINDGLLLQIEQDLNDYKRDYNMYEFSDMLSKFIEKKVSPSLDAIFLDEAQDLNPLQWKMFNYIEELSKRSYIAGDDDQAIYAFQGASPSNFINLKGAIDAQKNSVRVPRAIHQVALSILDHIEERLEKQWKPRDAEGEVIDHLELQDIDFSTGNWMILTRTNDQMVPIAEYLHQIGYRFDCKFNDLLPTELLEAINIWNRLNKGASISGEDVEILYNHLTKDQVKHGFLNKSYEQIDSVDIDDLRMSHGLNASGDWTILKMNDVQKEYIQQLVTGGEDLSKPARIKVSTIHSVKGEECDNVILFTDLEKIIYDAAQINKDTEHRLFFVGVTRAKNKLYIMNQDSEYQYNIGEEI
jgi:superfamily I DNA/RNA helicase